MAGYIREIILIIGIIIMFIGFLGAYLMMATEFFPAWFLVAFIGILMILVAIGMGPGEKS